SSDDLIIIHSLTPSPTRRSSDLSVAHDQMVLRKIRSASQQRMQLERHVWHYSCRGVWCVRPRNAPRPSFLASLSARAGRSLRARSEEHTSELQSRSDLVCRLLLE